MKHKIRYRHSENGQTLLIAVVAMLILIMAIFILFDVNTVIRGKVKAQNAVDAAAVVGANWQKNTLNLVGELNMVKACSVLISDEIFGVGAEPDSYLKIDNSREYNEAVQERNSKLRIASDTLSQMQLRMLFIGPLLGFGAAQQAAKNNGLSYNSSYGNAMKEQLNMVRGISGRASIYEPYYEEDFIKKRLYGFNWRDPYLNMLTEILQEEGDACRGISVLCNGQILGVPRIYTEGNPSSDFAQYLQNQSIYEAISSNYWCWIIDLLKMDFSSNGSKWWGELRLGTANNFREESEYLPVNVELRDASVSIYNRLNSTYLDPIIAESSQNYGNKLGDYYDTTDPVYDHKGNVVTNASYDAKIRILPAIDWAWYGYKWTDYSDSFVQTWTSFLRSPFRDRAKYRSGAVSRMDAWTRPVTVSGSMGAGKTARTNNDKYLGDTVSDSRDTTMRRAGTRIRYAERSMRLTPPRIYAYAVAKPYGWLTVDGKEEPPHYSGIVLPVFKQSAIIPSSLEDPGRNPLADYEWYQFLLRYLPALGTVNSFSEIDPALQTEFSYYQGLLRDKLGNDSWRQKGLNWLSEPTRRIKSIDRETGDVTYFTNEEDCTYMGGSSNNYSNWPASFH